MLLPSFFSLLNVSTLPSSASASAPSTEPRAQKLSRRQMLAHGASVGALVVLAQQRAWALSLADLSRVSQGDAASGVQLALSKGAQVAVELLGRTDGFLGNPKVRIALPGQLEDAAKLLRRFGQGARIDELETSLNRAAETAVPMGKDLLMGAVEKMTVTDAKNILTGGDTAVTQFFSEKTRTALGERFLPVVDQATQKVGLTQQYNAFAGKAASFGLIKTEDANLAQYVTGKTLDGLYFIIGEQEQKIRRDPVGTGSALLQKVFGAGR